MITCYLRYVIDPFKLKEFEIYGKMWIPLVEKFGGKHHGLFLPHEGPNNIALAMFSFPSLAAYETYRAAAADDPDCQAAEPRRCHFLLQLLLQIASDARLRAAHAKKVFRQVSKLSAPMAGM